MHVKPTHKRHKPSAVKIPYDTDLYDPTFRALLKSPEGLQSLYILIQNGWVRAKVRESLDTYKDLMKDAGSEEVTDAYESAVRGNEMILVCGEAALERFGREMQSYKARVLGSGSASSEAPPPSVAAA